MKIAVASAVFALCCSVLPATVHAQQSSSTCRPRDYSSKKNHGFRIKTLRVDTLRVKIAIGPCIPDDVARQIVRAFHEGRVRNLLALRSDGSRPELPKDFLARISSISVGKLEEVPPGGVATSFQYTVEMTDRPLVRNLLGGSGATVFIDLRDGHVEVVGSAIWMS